VRFRAGRQTLWIGRLTVVSAALAMAACGARAQASNAPPPSAGAAKAAGAPVRTFDVEAYDVDGAKVLPRAAIEAAVYPYMGPGRTAADVEKARAALEKAYHDLGYQSVVVETPPQSVADNIVRLHVIEATVGRLRVTGARYYSPEVVRHAVSAFEEGKVPDITRAQAELTELNREPGRRVAPILRAGAAPGTVDVDLKVSDTLPVHASVELGNDHNQDTQPLRLTGTVRYDNLFQMGQSATFTYVVAPQNRENSEVFSGSYLAPLWNTPFSLLVFGYDSNSNVATLGGVDVLGKGYSIGTRAILQLPRVGDLNQSVSFGPDFKNFNEYITFSKTNTADVVQYVPVTATYNFQFDRPKYSVEASIGVSAGIRGLGSDMVTFQNKRADSTANWVHLNLDVTQTWALGGGFEAAQRITGQLADQPLVASEEFAAGGFTSVRGYLQSEAVGDDGITGDLEIRTPSLAPKLGAFVDDLRFYVFGDGGAAWILDPQVDQTFFFTLASSGIGLRFNVLKYVKGDVAVAVPFITGGATHADRPRATFSLKTGF
jgi:hemolysin activation/secretion protein